MEENGRESIKTMIQPPLPFLGFGIILIKKGSNACLAEYQYDDELDQVFKACNLVSGMFQRLDKLCKNGFASVCIFS